MGIKQRKPFILHDKEAARREYEFSKLLTMSLIFSALIIPLINDFFFSYLHGYYVRGDYSLTALDMMLSYLLPAITVMATYFSYAAVVLSVYCYGVKKSLARISILMCGVLFSYLMNYLCVCVVNGYVVFDISDANGFMTLVSAMITAVFFLSKNTVLIAYTHFALKKMRKREDARWLSPSEQKGFFAFIKSVFGGKCVNRRIAVQFFSVSLACDLIVRTASTFMEIASAGAPEELVHYLYFAEQYALAVLNNLLGFVIMVIAGGILGRYVKDKEQTEK